MASVDAPNVLILLDMSRADEEQIGGGRHAPSPPPIQTLTHLRTIMKATTQDSSLVCDAQTCRRKLAPPQPMDEESQPVECTSILFRNGTEEYLLFPHEGQGPGKQGVIYEMTTSSQFAECPPASGGDVPTPASSHPPTSKGQPATSTRPPAASSGSSLPHILPPCIGKSTFFGECSMADLFGFEVSPPALCDLNAALAEVAAQRHAKGTATEGKTVSGVSQLLSVEALEIVPEAAEDDVDTPHQNLYRTPIRGLLPLSSNFPAGFDVPDCPNSPTPQWPTPDPFVVAGTHNADSEPSSSADDVFAVGRTSSTTLTILNNTFQKIYNDLSEVSGQVHMPLVQVSQRFTKQFAHSITWHPWNSYQRFWHANKVQELVRVKNVDLVHATPSMSPMQHDDCRLNK